MTATGQPLSALLRAARIEPLALTGGDPVVSGASLDSRTTQPGDVFLALRGLKSDGVQFVPEALRRGATAVLAQTPRPEDLAPEIAWVQVEQDRRDAARLSRVCYGSPDEQLDLIGITGTNGKTTVTYLFEAIARAAGRNVGRIGTIGYAYGAAQGASRHTTPEAPDLYRLLRDMSEQDVDLVAMEVSSHALALFRVESARFRVAAFLNLSRDHLDFHGDEETYFRAKARLFEGLDDDGHAVLPVASPYSERLRGMTRGRVTTFGREEADVLLQDEHCSLEGGSAVLAYPGGRIPVRTHLIGNFNLDNVAAAATCALALGFPVEAITTGIASVDCIPGRMERLASDLPFETIVDYAHTPDALEHLLRSLRPLTAGRLRLVFGCGGERDRSKRAPMGRIAAAGADDIYLTSDNPRSEDPAEIAGDIRSGVAEVPGGQRRTRLVLDRRAAIQTALRDASDGDVVVIAGKGHEVRQTVGAETRPFDDREVVLETFDELRDASNREAMESDAVDDDPAASREDRCPS